jgi:hypothetical protein
MPETAFVSAFLADVRAQADQGMVPSDDVLVLLRITQGVLDLAGDWEATQGTPYSARRGCADELRARVEREMLGEGEGDGQE